MWSFENFHYFCLLLSWIGSQLSQLQHFLVVWLPVGGLWLVTSLLTKSDLEETNSDPRILFRVCNLIAVTILRIPVNILGRFLCPEVCYGVVSVMEVLWDKQNEGESLMAFQWIGSHDTHQARPARTYGSVHTLRSLERQVEKRQSGLNDDIPGSVFGLH